MILLPLHECGLGSMDNQRWEHSNSYLKKAFNFLHSQAAGMLKPPGGISTTLFYFFPCPLIFSLPCSVNGSLKIDVCCKMKIASVFCQYTSTLKLGRSVGSVQGLDRV